MQQESEVRCEMSRLEVWVLFCFALRCVPTDEDTAPRWETEHYRLNSFGGHDSLNFVGGEEIVDLRRGEEAWGVVQKGSLPYRKPNQTHRRAGHG